MLQECGMKGLQNSFMATKSSSVSPYTCEGAANFALTVNQHSEGQCVVMPACCNICWMSMPPVVVRVCVDSMSTSTSKMHLQTSALPLDAIAEPHVNRVVK